MKRTLRSNVSVLGALTRGAVAGAVGTAAMDPVWFARHKRQGGEQGVWTWETSEGLDSWEDASAPGQVGRRVLRSACRRDPADRWARVTTNVMHWAYGLAWGAQYGIVLRSTKRSAPTWGLVLGPVVWMSDYVVLPLAKVYKPMWDYDAKTLWKDLSAHLVHGGVTGGAFAAMLGRR
ncbi:MAG TPA: hypothetical protein VK988_04420 [Acidimicrobiales bacterium]|nr:hypothetical protein [Acidimicrobiales bacterium]